jgi:hypothetical protein
MESRETVKARFPVTAPAVIQSVMQATPLTGHSAVVPPGRSIHRLPAVRIPAQETMSLPTIRKLPSVREIARFHYRVGKLAISIVEGNFSQREDVSVWQGSSSSTT